MKERGDKLRFSVAITVEPDNGEYHAYCEALKGLHTNGKTIDEAVANDRDAITANINYIIKHGEPIPVGILKEKKPILKRYLPGRNRTQIRIEDLVLTGV